MQIKLTMAALVAAAALQGAVPAAAQYRDDRRYDDRRYDHRQDRNRTYYGRSQDCRRSKGTTGTIAGAIGGGLIGNAVGGGTLGTLAGAGGGALLGRHIDQKHDAAQNRKNGC